ncbi:MAG: hypothetical protein EPO21_11860 [Chloroflexota bacterium]|nr:MAG: hypothetical protein EPO21_11860 [Chloroflexota bacterium]
MGDMLIKLAKVSPPFVRSSTVLVLGSFISSALGFIYWAAAARLFSPAEVGLGAGTISAMTMIANITLCGINVANVRFMPTAGHRQTAMMRGTSLATALLAALGGTVFIVGAPIWASNLVDVGVVLIISSAVWGVFTLQDSIMVGLGRAGWVLLKNGLFGLGKLALLVVAAFVIPVSGWQNVAGPWLLTAALTVFVAWIALEKSLAQPSTSSKPAQVPKPTAFARYALANHAGSILLNLPGLLYPILVLEMLGAENTAYFYTSWMMVYMLMLIAINVSNAMVAHAAVDEAALPVLLLQGLRYAGLLVLTGVIVLAMLGRLILPWFGPGYQQGYGLLILLSLGALAYTANSFYVSFMRIRGSLRSVILPGAIAGCLSLGLTWPLTRALGLTGFGAAFIIGQLTAALVVWTPMLAGLRRGSRRLLKE